MAKLAGVFLVGLFIGSQAVGQDLESDDIRDNTVDSAAFMLRESMTVQRNGSHNRMLRALRHLGDPTLAPLFNDLAQRTHPALQIHGLLGLAECDPNRKLDLVRVTKLDDARVQAEIISVAIESDLLDTQQAKQLFDWPDLDPAVRLVVATQLVRDEELADHQPLAEASQSSNLARHALAALLLAQSGDEAAMRQLQRLNDSTDRQRDQVRMLLLNTALQFGFDRIGPWAHEVSLDERAGAKLRLLALRTALRFGAPGAKQRWREQFESREDLAFRTRLALIALHLSPWIEGDLFATLQDHANPMLHQIGQTGSAIAAGQGVAEAVKGLLDLDQPIVTHWALSFAREQASESDAVAILSGMVSSYDGSDHRRRTRRLDEVVAATHALIERSPEQATALLRPLLLSPATTPELSQGILLGLSQSKDKAACLPVKDIGPLPNSNANRLAVFLLARHTHQLAQPQIEDLALIVRGGGGDSVPDTLRVQAAWTYLRLTKQIHLALTRVLQG